MNAVETIADPSFLVSLIATVRIFPFAEKVTQELLNTLDEKFPESVITWDTCKREAQRWDRSMRRWIFSRWNSWNSCCQFVSLKTIDPETTRGRESLLNFCIVLDPYFTYVHVITNMANKVDIFLLSSIFINHLCHYSIMTDSSHLQTRNHQIIFIPGLELMKSKELFGLFFNINRTSCHFS